MTTTENSKLYQPITLSCNYFQCHSVQPVKCVITCKMKSLQTTIRKRCQQALIQHMWHCQPMLSEDGYWLWCIVLSKGGNAFWWWSAKTSFCRWRYN